MKEEAVKFFLIDEEGDIEIHFYCMVMVMINSMRKQVKVSNHFLIDGFSFQITETDQETRDTVFSHQSKAP